MLMVNLADSRIALEKSLWRILLVVLIAIGRPYTVGAALSCIV